MTLAVTDREANVLQILWDNGPSLVSEVQDRLQDKLAYTTVLTILRTLEAKGYAKRTDEGKAHRYHAAIEPVQARRSALTHLTQKLFKGSTDLLLMHLVSDQQLSKQQLERIRELLASHEHGKKK